MQVHVQSNDPDCDSKEHNLSLVLGPDLQAPPSAFPPLHHTDTQIPDTETQTPWVMEDRRHPYPQPQPSPTLSMGFGYSQNADLNSPGAGGAQSRLDLIGENESESRGDRHHNPVLGTGANGQWRQNEKDNEIDRIPALEPKSLETPKSWWRTVSPDSILCS
jgi:hypothetical protein